MDYKNKYNDALEKLQEALAPKDGREISGLTRGCIESIFPELAMSEDEKIRKEIIATIHLYYGEPLEDEAKEMISWLKKQGNKPQGKTALEAIQEEKIDNSNKVEPKFHEGEWIVWQNKCYKVNYNGCGYELVDQNSLSTSLEYGTVDENAHLWDITKDAKDGELLTWDDSNCIAIFKNIYDEESFESCGYVGHFTGTFKSNLSWHDIKGAHPATKEQRDKLLKAMADAGYTFDFEKKELKELKKIEQNPVWSEEDDYNVQCLVAKVTSDIQNGNIGRNQELIDWLKSIKERVQPQPKQEWSEEDEKIALSIEQVMNCASLLNLVPEKIEKVRAWLKSLKERCTWKPSNIQMECLHDAVEHYHTNGYPASKLNELYEQMSKIYKL